MGSCIPFRCPHLHLRSATSLRDTCGRGSSAHRLLAQRPVVRIGFGLGRRAFVLRARLRHRCVRLGAARTEADRSPSCALRVRARADHLRSRARPRRRLREDAMNASNFPPPAVSRMPMVAIGVSFTCLAYGASLALQRQFPAIKSARVGPHCRGRRSTDLLPARRGQPRRRCGCSSDRWAALHLRKPSCLGDSVFPRNECVARLRFSLKSSSAAALGFTRRCDFITQSIVAGVQA
jgi:hypothetical protein